MLREKKKGEPEQGDNLPLDTDVVSQAAGCPPFLSSSAHAIAKKKKKKKKKKKEEEEEEEEEPAAVRNSIFCNFSFAFPPLDHRRGFVAFLLPGVVTAPRGTAR